MKGLYSRQIQCFLLQFVPTNSVWATATAPYLHEGLGEVVAVLFKQVILITTVFHPHLLHQLLNLWLGKVSVAKLQGLPTISREYDCPKSNKYINI